MSMKQWKRKMRENLMCFLSSTSNEKQKSVRFLSCLIYWFFGKQMQKYAHKIHSILFIVNYLTIHNERYQYNILFPPFLFFFYSTNRIEFYRDNKSLGAKKSRRKRRRRKDLEKTKTKYKG